MNLAQLRYLVAFADEGTLTQAARMVRASQPAVSQALRALEAELGVKLVERSGRRLTLTPDGKEIVAASRRALDAVSDIKTAVPLNRPHPPLRIAVYFTLVNSLYETIALYRRRWPKTSLRTIQTRTSQDAVDLVASGGADLACAEPMQLPPGLQFTPYTDLEVVLMSPPGCALPPAITVAMLNDLPLISIPDSPYRKRLFDAFFETSGVRPRIVLEADDMPSFIAGVRSGIGSTLVSRVEATGITGVEVRPFSPPYLHPIGYVHPRTANRQARDFLQLSKILSRRLEAKSAPAG